MTIETPSEQAAERRVLPLKGLVLLTVAGLSTITFVAIAVRVLTGHADSFDRSVTLAIHDIDTDTLDYVFIAFTTIGSGPCLWGAVLLVALLAIRNHRWQLALLIAANGVVAQIVNIGLKAWFVRPRPSLFDEIARPTSWSFPSGHSTSAVQIWGVIAAVLIALYPQRRVLVVASTLLLIAGIGLSRVYLGVHWATDVLAGFAAGLPFLAVSVHLIHRIMRVTRPQ
jgi:membrane-associated phospholipid phosphatase